MRRATGATPSDIKCPSDIIDHAMVDMVDTGRKVPGERLIIDELRRPKSIIRQGGAKGLHL